MTVGILHPGGIEGDIHCILAWIAGLFGLYMVDPVKSTVTTFTEAEGLDASDVYTLMTHDGLIYAGTGKGLTVLKQLLLGRFGGAH